MGNTQGGTLQEVYDPNVNQADSQTEEEKERVQFVHDRFRRMAEAKTIVESKFSIAKQFYEVFEKHLEGGAKWDEPYRFPELFGACQRRYDDLIATMPEVRVRASRDSHKDFAIATQSTYAHLERVGNTMREKSRAIWDSIFYGTGILFEGYHQQYKEISDTGDDLLAVEGNKRTASVFDGLVSQRVDPRDFFIDETTSVFFDETGLQGARDCVRRRHLPYSTFVRMFQKTGFKHVESVTPTSWGSDGPWPKLPYEKESEEQKTARKYVQVLEYWNQEEDLYVITANQYEIYKGSIPFKHKRLPFVPYYNYRRDDSIWGLSEPELYAPYIYAREEILNLMIMDAKLALQPALVVSGDVMLDTEEQELQPGAIFTMRGLRGGKVGDSMQPLRFADIPGDTFNVYKQIEDNQITTTGDDTRALYANPNQLATQTLAKREEGEKRNRSIIKQNTLDSEKQRAEIRISNMVQFYARPFQTIDGRVKYRRVKVEGYEVVQQGDETKPQFKQLHGSVSYFSLNPETLGETDFIEIEVVDTAETETLRKEELDDLNNFLQTVISLIPLNPAIAQDMNIMGLIKEMGKKHNLDYEAVFPMTLKDYDDDTIDSVDIEIDLAMQGVLPEIDMSKDPIKKMERFFAFQRTDRYKEARQQAKDTFNQLMFLTAKSLEQYNQQKLQAYRKFESGSNNQQQGLPQDGQVLPGGPGQGVPPVPRMGVPAGGPAGPQPAAQPVGAPAGV